MRQRGDESLRNWLERRTAYWRELRAAQDSLDRAGPHGMDAAMSTVRGYRAVARDLSLARRVLPGSRITQYLESLYASLHRRIHRPAHNWRAELVVLYKYEVPRVTRDLLPYIIAVTTLFVLSTMAGWWITHTYPELAALFASEKMINGAQQGELWTDDLLNIVPSSVLSVGIFANNLMVTFFAFALGAFYGLGTLYIIGLNGLMLGGVFAFTRHYGLDGRLFEFVVAHGIVELSVICLAGAAGAALGEALVRPGSKTRRAAFQAATAKAGKLLAVCAPLLLGCGLIEGFISPDPAFPLVSRIVVGSGFAVIMVLALSGALWGRQSRSVEDELP